MFILICDILCTVLYVCILYVLYCSESKSNTFLMKGINKSNLHIKTSTPRWGINQMYSIFKRELLSLFCSFYINIPFSFFLYSYLYDDYFSFILSYYLLLFLCSSSTFYLVLLLIFVLSFCFLPSCLAHLLVFLLLFCSSVFLSLFFKT